MASIIARTLKSLGKVPIIGDYLNVRAINKYAKAIPPRPRPYSMHAPYTTWRGLTDRRLSGRHLPPDPEFNRKLPPIEAVADLFKQTEDARASDTSLLFPFFAQWFTDSFLRTKWKPDAEQDFAHNESNHEIDLCQIYGTDEDRTAMLRSFSDGKLKNQIIDGEEYPVDLFEKNDGEFVLKKEFKHLYSEFNFNRVFSKASEAHKQTAFAVGLEHGNSTMGNTLMNTLFLREHNRIAAELSKEYPRWGDERIFQTARNINIVILLNIVISDYIVHIAPVDFPLRAIPGTAEKENWYRTNLITVEFALLYRWHSFIPKTVHFGGVEKPSVSLRNNNSWVKQIGIDTLCREASSQKAGRLGLGNTADFLVNVSALNLNMARTCQLTSFNNYRRHYGLDPKHDFDDVTKNSQLSDKLKELYGDVEKMEWFVGLYAEDYSKSSMMGELMMMMVANDAFTQALTNPLLSKNIYNANTFSEVGLKIIENSMTLADVIQRNTGVSNKKEVGFKVKRYTGPTVVKENTEKEEET